MDKSFWIMILQIFVFLPFIIILIYLSLKFGGNKLNQLQQGRFIKIFERTSLSKDNSLFVVKMGEKGYILTSTNGRIEILKELEEKELTDLSSQKAALELKNLKELYEKLKLKRKGNQ